MRERQDFPANPVEKPGHRLEWSDEVDGSDLDPTRWLPLYVPHWCSRTQAAPRYAVRDGTLVLQITAGHLRRLPFSWIISRSAKALRHPPIRCNVCCRCMSIRELSAPRRIRKRSSSTTCAPISRWADTKPEHHGL